MLEDEHNWFSDHAAAYVMGGLSADERARIESHAAACADCAAFLWALRETDQTMNTLFASMRPTAGFEQAIIARLDRPMRLVAKAGVNPFVRRAAVAAAAAIVLGGFGYVASEKINNDRWPSFAFFDGGTVGTGQAMATSQRVASSMRQIGQAIELYSSGFRAFPGQIYSTATPASPTPDWARGPKAPAGASSSAATNGEVFTVPSSMAQKWDYGGGTNSAGNWANWNGGKAGLVDNESYSYQDPYPRAAKGQNDFYGDGHVQSDQNPFVGQQRDNIMVKGSGAITLNRGTSNAPGVVAGDTILLPTEEKSSVELKGANDYSGGTALGYGFKFQRGDKDDAKAPATPITPAPAALYYHLGTAAKDDFGVDRNGQANKSYDDDGNADLGNSINAPIGNRSPQQQDQQEILKKRDLAFADSTSAPGAVANAESTPAPAPDSTQGQAPPANSQPPALQPMQRKVIRNGTMDFVVDSFDSAFLQVAAIVAEEGGYVGTTNSDKMPNGKVQGTITIRIAPDHLDVLVLKLRALGELKGQKITADDVTKEYTDLASELRAARAMEERLLELIKDGKGAIKDLLAAEKELGDWREKIEKITGQMNYYDNLVAMSTLELTLTEKDIKTPALASQSETVDMGVETEDVERARTDAISAVDEVKGRIVESELKQFDAGQLAGKIVADVPPDKAGPVIDRLKQLGKVSRLEVQRQEVTTDGHGNAVDANAVPAGLRVEQRDTSLTLSLYNLANVAPRQTVNAELACDDVEASYHAILDRVSKAGGRVLSSNLSRPMPDQVTGSLSFEVKSADADGVLLDVKQAGEVMNSNVTENPDTNNVTSTKRGFSVNLRSLASVNPREVRTMAIATSDVTAAYGKLLAAVQGLKARVIVSKLDNETDGNDNQQNETAGWLDFEVKRGDIDVVEHALRDAGDSIQRQVLRSNDDQNTLDTKVQFKVGLHNATLLPPRENWTLSVESGDVDGAQADVLSAANSAGGRIVDSTLSKEANGKTTAHMVIDVPLGQSAVVVDRVKHEGDVRVVQSTKNPQAPEGTLARSRLEITIASPEAIVSGDRGLWGSVRAGLTTSVAGLLWSLQLIVIGLCLVGPFVGVIWVGRKLWKWSRATA